MKTMREKIQIVLEQFDSGLLTEDELINLMLDALLPGFLLDESPARKK